MSGGLHDAGVERIAWAVRGLRQLTRSRTGNPCDDRDKQLGARCSLIRTRNRSQRYLVCQSDVRYFAVAYAQSVPVPAGIPMSCRARPSGRPLDSLPMLQRGLAFAHRGALSGPMREVQPPQDSDVAANELRARQQVPCCALARAKGSTSLLGRPLDSSPMLQGGLAFAHKGTLSGPMREVQPPQDSEVAAH